MNKYVAKTPLTLALAALVVGGGLLVHQNAKPYERVRALPQEGDLYGAARVNFKKSSEVDSLATIHVVPGGQGGVSFAGTGLYLRMKNYTGINTYINTKLKATNGAMIGPKQGVQHTYYNASGTEVTYSDLTLRDYNNYLILPANFDGYVYMNYSTQMEKAVGSNDRAFRYTAITMYFEISTKYDTYADFAIGDIFTDDHSILDSSTLTVAEFPNNYVNESTDYLNITQLPRTDEYEPKGDLLGSANIKTGTSYGGFHVLADGKSGSDGVYLRIKNNDTNPVSMLTHFNSRNNGRATATAGAKYYLLDKEGQNKTEYSYSSDKMLTIPASYDGFLLLPMTSYSKNTDWSSETFNSADLYALYLEGVIADLDIGDITTKEVSIYDGSTIYPADFASHFVNDWGCTLKINEGHAIPPEVEFPYEEVQYISSIEEGNHVTCLKDTNDTIATFNIVLPQISDFSNGLAITVRMKAISGDFPFFFRIIDEDDNISHLASNSAKKKAKYVNNGTVINASSGGNDHSIKYPNGLDGELIIPVSTLEAYTENMADLSKVKAFQVGIAVKYDYDFNAVFGDIGYIVEESKTQVLVLTCAGKSFDTLYQKKNGAEFLKFKEYYSPSECPWIGDVKILNPLKYDNNEALKEEIVWNEGDNACSYEVMDDGMFVHIGPYETGHQYGNYMCLQMSEKGVYTDRTDWTRVNASGEKELAKGITCYVKNLSRKEIGLTLQFDELTKFEGKDVYERWCIKGYPAMYYAWDVKTNAEYTFYCKSDQFQIPVGFEGYVRIPFESYLVPDWCQPIEGVDNVLDIEKWSGMFYLTSDNTRFEDLEYFIKNVGVYFNETRRGTLFDSSNTIKANMGL